MKNVKACLLFLLLPMLNYAKTLQPGVSAELATHRTKVISRISYTLNFKIPGKLTEPIPATEELGFTLKDAKAAVQIDFKQDAANLHRITVNGKPVPVMHQSEHIIIQPQYLIKGLNTVAIDFTAGTASLNRNAEFLYTLLVPDRARTVFPCFDQPDLKAVFKLTLTVPSAWKAVANGLLKDSVATAEATTYHFEPSERISTYLFAFAAGKFYQNKQLLNGRTMNLYYRETDSAKIKNSINPILSIQADAISFMEDYTQIKYPFQKFDCVAIPDFQYGGMEHPGSILYKAAGLFLDESAVKDQLNARANVLAHETAHMWFGDMVTMRWFNDVWMKEVFANFMADKISNVTLKDNNYALKFLTSHYPPAYDIDRTAGANPIRQQLDNLQDAGSMYGNIIYHKAPIMMRQLERLMGAEAFRAGLRVYLKKYAYGNATWPDLISILDARTPADLQAWNKVWVNEAGRPRFSYQLKTDGGKITSCIISQKGEAGSPRVWPQAFGLTLVYADHVEELSVNMNSSTISLKAAEGKAAPLYVLFNSDGEGYGVFPVDEQSLGQLARVSSPLMRASAYINLYENMLSGRSVTPAGLLKLNEAALLTETEELNLNLLLDQLGAAFWRFTPRAQWGRLAPQLEETLWTAMQKAGTANTRKQLFKAYSGIAFTEASQKNIYNIWKDQKPPAGVKLVEEDFTALATGLALRNYPGCEEILKTQLSRIQNPDRIQRLQFLMPALSNDVVTRDAFFATLKQKQNRAKEAWVGTALSYIHHPLRTAVSEKYLPESLSLLAEIQRTGDIFFPQSWLQATFGWYQTPTAATVIRQFLKDNPSYNLKLKAKILQAGDGVFRAEQLAK